MSDSGSELLTTGPVRSYYGSVERGKADSKIRGGRKPGTRVRVTAEKEALVRQLHGQKKPVAVIAHLVGLSRKTVYEVLRRA